MTEQTNQAPEAGAEGTGHDAAPPTAGQQVDWQTKAQEWQSRFTGLQGKYQQERTRWAEDVAQLHELDTQLQTLTGDHEKTLADLTGLHGQHDALQTELKVAKETHDRLHLIMADYPDLIEFEVKGLLPDGSGDELKGKLTAFKEALKARGAAAVQNTVAGSTPPPPAPNPPKDAKTLLNEAMAAARSGDRKRYDELYGEYLKAVAAGTK